MKLFDGDAASGHTKIGSKFYRIHVVYIIDKQHECPGFLNTPAKGSNVPVHCHPARGFLDRLTRFCLDLG